MKLEKRLPKELVKAAIKAAQNDYELNKAKIGKSMTRDAYILGFIHGFETAWSIYTDEDEEVLSRYDERS